MRDAFALMIQYPRDDSSKYMMYNTSAHNFPLDFGIKIDSFLSSLLLLCL